MSHSSQICLVVYTSLSEMLCLQISWLRLVLTPFARFAMKRQGLWNMPWVGVLRSVCGLVILRNECRYLISKLRTLSRLPVRQRSFFKSRFRITLLSQQGTTTAFAGGRKVGCLLQLRRLPCCTTKRCSCINLLTEGGP
eukprot:m.138926 g.138926  ORF g.138926 m.138926 type:complete len:139 (-) comp14006_c0_seq3:1576-1992(-)